MSPNEAAIDPSIEPSIRNALPHYLPLCIFPLLIVAAIHGGWWLLPPFLFMSVAGPLDRALGLDGRNMNPAKTPERRLIWHNLPVWAWAVLWPPTLVFGMWQILVANPFAIWEDVILAILLTMEAQAVFVVGHELIHRRSAWERRLAEFLLASASYPQYASEHVYVHHAQVGTPHDVGSPPRERVSGPTSPGNWSAISPIPGGSPANAWRGAVCPRGTTATPSGDTAWAWRSGGGSCSGWAASGRFRFLSSSVWVASFR